MSTLRGGLSVVPLPHDEVWGAAQQKPPRQVELDCTSDGWWGERLSLVPLEVSPLIGDRAAKSGLCRYWFKGEASTGEAYRVTVFVRDPEGVLAKDVEESAVAHRIISSRR